MGEDAELWIWKQQMAEEDEAVVGDPRKLPHWCVWFVLGLLIVVEEAISCLINDIWFCFLYLLLSAVIMQDLVNLIWSPK